MARLAFHGSGQIVQLHQVMWFCGELSKIFLNIFFVILLLCFINSYPLEDILRGLEVKACILSLSSSTFLS